MRKVSMVLLAKALFAEPPEAQPTFVEGYSSAELTAPASASPIVAAGSMPADGLKNKSLRSIRPMIKLFRRTRPLRDDGQLKLIMEQESTLHLSASV